MRVLAVTNIFPAPDSPASGVFIGEQVSGLRSRGIEVQVLMVNRRREGPWIYYRMETKLRKAMAEFAPDLIHVMYGGVMAAQVTAKPGLPPVVVTFHGSDLLGENLSGWIRKFVSRYGVYCSRRAARRAQGVVVVARHLLRALGKRVDTGKIRLIPCGINVDRFKPLGQQECRERLGWAADAFYILFASSAGDPVKRPQLAQAAAERLARERSGVQYRVLAGVPNNEVPLWLNASDVLLLTSRHEGSPTIVKEALACGLPVVSVPVGDVLERIGNINGCYLAEPEPGDLSRKLSLAYERRTRVDCRESLRELSLQAVARKLEEFYAELLTCPAARRGPSPAGMERNTPSGVRGIAPA
jgi:glycosyltransferase involved in cell wall biosynthesis